MANLLCIGSNDAAMQTRTLILERAGYSVAQVRDLRHIQAECETKAFSVAILGQDIHPSEKKRITEILFIHCKDTKILELHLGITPELPEADAHLQINVSEPERLVEAVNTLLTAPRKKKAWPAS